MNKLNFMNIRKHKIPICCLLATLLMVAAACAKQESAPLNEAAKRAFDAWLSVNHPTAKPTGLGIYILDDRPGTGTTVGDNDTYLFVSYTTRDLKGTITGTNEKKIAQQLGTYSEANYYGSKALLNDRSGTPTGLLETIKGMRVGGTRTAIVPGWLNVIADYRTADEYLRNKSGDAAVYTITLDDKTSDITQWEIDTLRRYVAGHLAGVDSTRYGYYYRQLKAPSDTTTLPRDTSIYINYTGRLLNGQVFDTTVGDTAKMYGLHSAKKKYAPVKIKLNQTYTEITMSTGENATDNPLVEGFSYCLSRMKRYEKGVCAFYSVRGYSYSGIGNTIPPFAPIVFEIELVDKPK